MTKPGRPNTHPYKTSPTVLISLLTYNSEETIAPVIESILNQSYKNVNLCISDNGSTDNTVKTIKKKVPEATIVQNENIGYGKAHNRVISSSREDFLLILNDDVILHKDYIKSSVEFMKSNNYTAALTGLLFEAESLDTLEKNERGLDLYLLTPYRKTKPVSMKSDRSLIYGITGAAPFFRLDILRTLSPENFDEDFFMYFEDVDICWRLHRAGYSIDLNDETFGWHMRSYSFKKRKKLPLHLRKCVYLNRYFTILKNENFKDFLLNLPFFIAYESVQFLYILLFDIKCMSLYSDFIKRWKHFYKKKIHSLPE